MEIGFWKKERKKEIKEITEHGICGGKGWALKCPEHSGEWAYKDKQGMGENPEVLGHWRQKISLRLILLPGIWRAVKNSDFKNFSAKNRMKVRYWVRSK